jgi:hypothetical protein
MRRNARVAFAVLVFGERTKADQPICRLNWWYRNPRRKFRRPAHGIAGRRVK